MIFWAIFFPPAIFFWMGRPLAGFVIALLLGAWPLVSLWAIYALTSYEAQKALDDLEYRIEATLNQDILK